MTGNRSKGNKKFGYTLAAAGLVIAISHWRHPFYCCTVLSIATLILVSTWVFPAVLIPLEKYWGHLGEFLGKINTTILLTLVYLALMTPISVILKVFRVDLLRLKRNKRDDSYWETPSSTTGSTMLHQF